MGKQKDVKAIDSCLIGEVFNKNVSIETKAKRRLAYNQAFRNIIIELSERLADESDYDLNLLVKLERLHSHFNDQDDYLRRAISAGPEAVSTLIGGR